MQTQTMEMMEVLAKSIPREQAEARLSDDMTRSMTNPSGTKSDAVVLALAMLGLHHLDTKGQGPTASTLTPKVKTDAETDARHLLTKTTWSHCVKASRDMMDALKTSIAEKTDVGIFMDERNLLAIAGMCGIALNSLANVASEKEEATEAEAVRVLRCKSCGNSQTAPGTFEAASCVDCGHRAD
jgi:hypothetical protein